MKPLFLLGHSVVIGNHIDRAKLTASIEIGRGVGLPADVVLQVFAVASLVLVTTRLIVKVLR